MGSFHSVNNSVEYRLGNTTSAKLKLNKNFQDPEGDSIETSLTVREQLNEELALEMTATHGILNELRLAAISNINLLEKNSENPTTVEVEAKVREHLVNGTVKIKNNIGEFFGTSLEVNIGAAGDLPLMGISTDISFNLYYLLGMFRNFK